MALCFYVLGAFLPSLPASRAGAVTRISESKRSRFAIEALCIDNDQVINVNEAVHVIVNGP
jgi:hypothetical protein